MLVEIIIAGVVITFAIIAIVLYFLWRKSGKPADCSKAIDNGMSKVSVRANIDLDEVIVEDMVYEEKLKFARANLKSGENVEFVYPASMARAHIILRFGGKEETVDVEIK